MNMNTRYIRLSAVLAAAISLTACSFSSLDIDKKAHDYGYNVADEDGYIKSFNVGTAAKVEPETKTLFHTEEGSYGLTTWEPGTDELSFILRDSTGSYAYMDEPEHWQRFGCESSFEKESYEGPGDIKWAKYTVLDGNTGLQVGQNYYAYYMNGKESVALSPDYLFVETFNQTGQSDISLQNFMRSYDYLELEASQHGGNDVANGGIIVKSPMGDVYMDHYFALVEVDIHWKADMYVKNNFGGGYSHRTFKYPFFCVQFGSMGGEDIFTKCVHLDEYGKLKDYQFTSFVINYRKDSNEEITLTESNNLLKYYFLVRAKGPSNHYWIQVFNAPALKRTIHYVWDEGGLQLKPGFYYKFDVDADFSKLLSDQNEKEWQDHGQLIARDSLELAGYGIRTHHENN